MSHNEELPLPNEVWAMILEEALDSVQCVNRVSLVCRQWRSLVYEICWKFCGFVPFSVLVTFPFLPVPKRAMLCLPENILCTPGVMNAETVEKEEKVLRYVRERGIERLWLNITLATRTQVGRPIIFIQKLLEEGVRDLLLRENNRKLQLHTLSSASRVTKYERGFRYQKDWQCPEHPEWGNGLLALDTGCYDIQLMTFLAQLSPVYLILHGDLTRVMSPYNSLLSKVKIMGITGNICHRILQKSPQLQELRILESNPFDPLEPERYGVTDFSSVTQMYDLPYPLSSLSIFRGAISDEYVSRMIKLLPNVREIGVVYRMKDRKEPRETGHVTDHVTGHVNLKNRMCRLRRLRGFHARTFVRTFDMRSFWTCISSELFENIAQHLSFRDLTFLTQVFRIREKIQSLRCPSIPIHILRNSFQHLYLEPSIPHPAECVVTVSTEAEYALLDNVLYTRIPYISIQGGEPLISHVLENIESRLRSMRTTALHHISCASTIISFISLPGAYITIHRPYLLLHLPISYWSWNSRFLALQQELTIPHPQCYNDHHPQCWLPTCHFF